MKTPICSKCNEIFENNNVKGRPRKYCFKCSSKKRLPKNIVFNSMDELLKFVDGDKKCKFKLCKKKLKGKRRMFCSDNCKKRDFYFKNKNKNLTKALPVKKACEEILPNTIEYHNRILSKNYSIIEEIYENTPAPYLKKVLKSELIDKGYNFNYFTHYLKTEKKSWIFKKEIISTCIYDYTIELKNDFVFLIKRIEKL